MLSLVALLAIAAAEPSPASIEGRWVNPDHTVIIDIAPCGGALCGTVAWATAQAQQDAKKGTANLIGSQLLTDLQPSGAAWQGHLFVPDEDLRARAKIESQGANQLKVSGCVMMICKSQTWSRAEGPLPKDQ